MCQYLGWLGRRFVAFLLIVFLFILFGNFFGLVPYGKTPTTYLALTLVLAFSLLIGCIALGFVNHGFKFFRLFILKVN